MFRNWLTFTLVLLAAAVSVAEAQLSRPVRLTTADDVGIAGVYYPVASGPAPAVLLIHSFERNHTDWDVFATALQRNGIAALAIDLRGHGESTRRLTSQGPELMDFHRFTPRDYQDMLLDVEAAMDWLTDQPGIDKQRVGIVGSSLGANVAMRYTLFNEDLAALVLLSPGIVYKDLRTDDAMQKLGPMPLRIAVSRNDPFAFESCKRLIELRKESGHGADTNELIICTGYLHGTDMLKGVRDLPTILIDWLKQTLSRTPAAAPESPAPSKEPVKPAQ